MGAVQLPSIPTTRLPDEAPLIVPGEKVLSRTIRCFLRQSDFAPVQCEVVLAVVEVRFEPLADLHAVFGSHGEVAAIEERVRVAAQQEPVIDTVFAAFGIWTNVGRLEDGKLSLGQPSWGSRENMLPSAERPGARRSGSRVI
ncbi:MAG: hypothetical protein WB498_08650 [Candidatus Binatus sp.]